MKRILNWFRLRNLDSDLDRELSYHFDRRVDDLIRSGHSQPEARRQATLELGVPHLKEEVRDIWLIQCLRDFVYDLRFSLRSFLRNPSFPATALLSLALGIGATTAIYSLLDQIVRRSLPIRDPQQLVLIDWIGDTASVNAFGSYNLMSYPLCRDLHKQTQFFDGVLCRATTNVTLSTSTEAKFAVVELVSGTYFPTLGTTPALGRLLAPEDDGAPGASPVAVLSHDYWRNHFAADPYILGRKVLVNHHPITIIGVAAPSFRGIDVGVVPALWIPASMSGQIILGFDNYLNPRVKWMQILGRLKPGVTPAHAQTGLQPWFQALLRDDARLPNFPRVTPERLRQYLSSTLEITPAPQGHSVLRRRLSQPLWVLLAATAMLLGLACLNVAGLFLARASAREREISTRLALGASRGRIGRQLFADSLLLSFVGGALGIALAPLAMRALIALLPADGAPAAVQSSVDTPLLVSTFLISVAAGILTGFAPAIHAGRRSLITSLRERAGSGTGGLRLRRIIVTAQIAFTLILVIGAALFIRTLAGLVAKGPGFDTSSLISFGIHPRRNGYTPDTANQLIRRIRDEMLTAGSTQSVVLARQQLLTGGSWNHYVTMDHSERATTDRIVHLNSVSPGFFAALGARFIDGRDFDERDTLPTAQGGRDVAVVNQAFVKRYLAGRNPIGVRIAIGTGPAITPQTEIIGVVADISYRGVREEWEQAYFPLRNNETSLGGVNFYLRMRTDAQAALPTIRAILHRIDPTLSIDYIRTLDEQVNRSLNTERMLAAISTSFGAIALLLSLVGLYGVMSFVVTQRTREIGIRMALGATRLAAIWMVLRDALLMIAAGTAIALPTVWALGRWIESQLFDIKPTDPVTIGGAVLVLCLASLSTALIPAHRASTVDPNEALRFD